MDLVDAVIKGTGSVYCPLDGAAGALLDGSLWHEVAKCYSEKDTTVALEFVHNAIIEHTLKEEGII